ncbi:hypothetical protein [Brevundimonas sp.]
MTKSDWMPSRGDLISLSITGVCVALVLVLWAMNGMMELGEVAHDAFCPDHGWAVTGA